MMPKGWALLTVGDIFDVQLGKMLNKEAKKKQPQLRYLGNSNVRWGEFELSELNSMYFSEREINKYKLEFNDILVCEGGEVGRCAIWEQHNSQTLYQKALHRLRVKGDIVPRYFQNYMQSIAGTKLLEDYTSRTSIAHLTREKLLSLPIKLPPLPEQQKIAKILSTWDKVISTTERLIENSTQQKKALMQQLLTGKKRLLDDEGKRFEGEWEETALIDTADSKKYSFTGGPFGSDLKSSDYSTTGVRIIQLQNIGDGCFNNGYKIYTTEEKADQLISCNIYPNEIIISKMGDPVARATLIPDFHSRYLMASDGIRLAVDKSKYNTNFVLETINSSAFRGIALSKSTGSTRRRIGLTDLKNITFNCPTLPEQQKIATVLTTAYKEIELLEQQLADLQQEKKALMQQLLTGKKRVVVDEEVV